MFLIAIILFFVCTLPQGVIEMKKKSNFSKLDYINHHSFPLHYSQYSVHGHHIKNLKFYQKENADIANNSCIFKKKCVQAHGLNIIYVPTNLFIANLSA